MLILEMLLSTLTKVMVVMARKYTPYGTGDTHQADEPEDTRPVCQHCGNHQDDDGATHCSLKCWHLDNIGEVRAHILLWLKNDFDHIRIFEIMTMGGDDSWFSGMTDSTVSRWCRAINNAVNRVNNKGGLNER